MFNQLQSWPTPEMFIRRQSGTPSEPVSLNVVLSDFVAIVGVEATAADDYTTAVAMSTMLVNGPQPISNNDNYRPTVSLGTFEAITADNIGTSTEPFAAANSLSAFVAVTAQVMATQTENNYPTVSLGSFVI